MLSVNFIDNNPDKRNFERMIVRKKKLYRQLVSERFVFFRRFFTIKFESNWTELWLLNFLRGVYLCLCKCKWQVTSNSLLSSLVLEEIDAMKNVDCLMKEMNKAKASKYYITCALSILHWKMRIGVKMRKKKVMGIWEGIIWMEKRALKLISQINLSLLLLANIKTRLLEFGITSFLLVNPTPTLPLTDTDRSFCQNIFYFLFLILALDWWWWLIIW